MIGTCIPGEEHFPLPPSATVLVVWFSYPLEYYIFFILAQRLSAIHIDTTFLASKSATNTSIKSRIGSPNNVKPSPYAEY